MIKIFRADLLAGRHLPLNYDGAEFNLLPLQLRIILVLLYFHKYFRNVSFSIKYFFLQKSEIFSDILIKKK